MLPKKGKTNQIYTIITRMAERLGAEEVVVVTSRYHMPRSSWTFRVAAAALQSRVRLGEAASESAETPDLLEREKRFLRRSPEWMRQAQGAERVEGMEGIEETLEEINRMLQSIS